jgi:hypothetical protein
VPITAASGLSTDQVLVFERNPPIYTENTYLHRK